MRSGQRGSASKPARTRRGLWLLVPVLYVTGAAIHAGDTSPVAWLAIGLGALLAYLGARARDDEPASAVRERRWVFGAGAITVATAALSSRPPWAASLREMAAAASAVVAARALGALEGDAGLASRATEAASGRALGAPSIARFAALAGALAWSTAAGLDVMEGLGIGSTLAAPSLLAAACGASAFFVLGCAGLLVAGARRLELGAPPRAFASAAASAVGLLVAITLAVANVVRVDGAVAACFGLAAIVTVWLARAPDAVAVARNGRRVLTLAMFGGPAVTLTALVAEGRGGAPFAIATALAALTVGALARRLEEPLLPVRGRLLDALEDATRAARDRDPRAAIASALSRLGAAAGHGAEPAELWILGTVPAQEQTDPSAGAPGILCTVDAAGYLREQPGAVPPVLLEIARGEPDGAARLDVLRALEVRRADLRPTLRWLESRGALFATLVTEGEEADGLLVIPAGGRTEPVTIEEVRASKGLADTFVAICQARSARERHLGRERALSDRIDALDDELARVRYDAERSAARHALAAARLARPATIGMTSAASRLAYDALERRIENDAPTVVFAPPGVDAVPFIARAHLAGRRKGGPLVVVDGTSTREHDPERWKDGATSPLALADGGLLVLVDGAALARDVQVLIAKSLGERRAPWERAAPLDVALVVTTATPPERLVEEGRLAPELSSRLGDAPPVELPRLRDRAEDLFSIVADRLAREGLRVRGRPVGIDASAFALLIEHPFEAEDAELTTIVARLVAHAEGDIVRLADVRTALDGRGLEERPERSVKGPRGIR